jgi:hypothetical protein
MVLSLCASFLVVVLEAVVGDAECRESLGEWEVVALEEADEAVLEG